ncbi:MAG: type IV pilus assembly protein PilM [Planctomycetota bacterium]|jgi:type IV pilus assembly protein PilM
MAFRNLIGLDIGSKFIKAVQLTENNGEYTITGFGAMEVPPQYSIPDAILELFHRKKFRTKRVVTAVAGRFVFVRYINMPVMTDQELINAAKYELGKYIPVEVDEVLHDSQKLEELPVQEGQDPEMRVLLVAAKRTFLDEHVSILETAALKPAIVDVDSFALGNAYELTGLVNQEAVRPGRLIALVDVGASKTNINIMSDQISYFTREFYKGGNDLTEAISKRLALELREAETLKRNPGNDMDRVQDCIAGPVDDICHDINISIDYFENQYDKQIEEVFLTGGAGNTIGLLETLEKTVNKPVARWAPVKSVRHQLDRESAQELEEASHQAAIALGLASRIRKE